MLLLPLFTTVYEEHVLGQHGRETEGMARGVDYGRSQGVFKKIALRSEILDFLKTRQGCILLYYYSIMTILSHYYHIIITLLSYYYFIVILLFYIID